MNTSTARRRVALVGVGHRGLSMWGLEMLQGYAEWVDLVGLCDHNPHRLQHAHKVLGRPVATYHEVSALLNEQRPDAMIVCLPDHLHDDVIVTALHAGCDVITEKPLAVSSEQCKRILEAEQQSGRRVDVAFNYRYTPTAAKIKQLLMQEAIGPVQSVDFHWYLDTLHGADYFRRWHAQTQYSGSLFVHKASHHFDLLNWWLDDTVQEVYARAALRQFGRQGTQGGTRCSNCTQRCPFFLDLAADPWLHGLYEAASVHDGYVRDACVFRPEIDVPDTMSAVLQFRGGAQATYSLSAYLPIEGYQIAFNGLRGRIEVRQHERQPWAAPPADEIRLLPHAGPAQTIWVAHGAGGHFGGDRGLQDHLFKPGTPPDTLGQRAGAQAGALAALTGLAALQSAATGMAQTVTMG